MIKLSLIIPVFLLAGCSRDTVSLGFQMQPGEAFEQQMDMTMEMEQPLMGQNEVTTQRMSMYYRYQVTGDSAGWKRVEAVITRVVMDMSGMGEKFSYDSNSADSANADHPMAQVFGSMKGKFFYFTINDQGQVGDVGGMQQMRRHMEDALGDTSMAVQPLQLEQIRKNIQQAYAAYPAGPVKVGASWKQEGSLAMPGMQVKSVNTYKLSAVKDSVAVVDVRSKIAGEPGGQSTLEGGAEGEMKYHLRTGIPVEGNLVTRLDMKLSQGGEQVAMKATITTQIRSTLLR